MQKLENLDVEMFLSCHHIISPRASRLVHGRGTVVVNLITMFPSATRGSIFYYASYISVNVCGRS